MLASPVLRIRVRCAPPANRQCTNVRSGKLPELEEELLTAALFIATTAALAADHRVVFLVTTIAEAKQHFSLKVHFLLPRVPPPLAVPTILQIPCKFPI